MNVLVNLHSSGEHSLSMSTYTCAPLNFAIKVSSLTPSFQTLCMTLNKLHHLSITVTHVQSRDNHGHSWRITVRIKGEHTPGTTHITRQTNQE